jgi:hypothetical protein
MFTFGYIWWIWSALVLLAIVPVSYGWGYLGWGAPYPRYVQRRRMQQATRGGTSGAFDHQAWGLGGDLVWLLVVVDVLFFVALLRWR